MNSKAEIVFYVVIGVYKDLYGIFYHFFEKWAHTPKYLTTPLSFLSLRELIQLILYLQVSLSFIEEAASLQLCVKKPFQSLDPPGILFNSRVCGPLATQMNISYLKRIVSS